MGRKKPEDREMENRIRAHIRKRMEELEMGVSEAAGKIGCDQGYLTRVLQGERGIGVGMAARIFRGLAIDPLEMFLKNPDPRFFQTYVPKPT